MMDPALLTIFIAGFLPTWLALASIYYRLGKLETELKYVSRVRRRRRRL